MNSPSARERLRMAGWLLPLFAGLALSGCQTARMALPPDLRSGAVELAVEGRELLIFNDSFRMGPYHVTDVHRGWTRGTGTSASIGGFDVSESETSQRYAFSVTEADRPAWRVRCATTAGWSQMETEGFLGGRFGVELSSDQQLVCDLRRDGGGALSRLVMSLSASAGETALRGVVMDGATRIDIAGTHELEETPLRVSAPTGYVFQVAGRPVGAVEIINEGAVWIDNSVTPEIRSALAAISAILLLYQDVKEFFD